MISDQINNFVKVKPESSPLEELYKASQHGCWLNKLSHHHTINYVNLFGEIVKILNAY